MVKRTVYKGVVRLRWGEPRAFAVEALRAAVARHGRSMLRGLAIGVALGLAIIVTVWFVQPLARPYLPRAALGLFVMPPVYAALFAFQVGVSIAFGRHCDLRRDRLVLQEPQGGFVMSSAGLASASIELAGDVPFRLVVDGRLGHPRLLSKRSVTRRVGIDPSIEVEELVAAVKACLGIVPEVVGGREREQRTPS